MRKNLLYISNLSTFTDDSTGEVVSGGRIAICDDEASTTNSGKGCYTDIKWISKELHEKLFKDERSNHLPCKIELELENRGLNSKPRLVDINFVD